MFLPRVTNGFSSAVPVVCSVTDRHVCLCVCVSVSGVQYSRPGVVGCMQSPWFILELQCYDPSDLAHAPLDRMDKIDCLSLFLYCPFSFFYLSQVSKCLSILCLKCKCTMGNALSMFCPLCSLAQPLILLSDKQTFKNIHWLPLCLPDLCQLATPFHCRLHFQPWLFKTHRCHCAWRLREEKEFCQSVCLYESLATTPSCSPPSHYVPFLSLAPFCISSPFPLLLSLSLPYKHTFPHILFLLPFFSVLY